MHNTTEKTIQYFIECMILYMDVALIFNISSFGEFYNILIARPQRTYLKVLLVGSSLTLDGRNNKGLFPSTVWCVVFFFWRRRILTLLRQAILSACSFFDLIMSIIHLTVWCTMVAEQEYVGELNKFLVVVLGAGCWRGSPMMIGFT